MITAVKVRAQAAQTHVTLIPQVTRDFRKKGTSDLLCSAIFNRNFSVNENHVFRAFASGLQTGRSLRLPLYKPKVGILF